MRGCWRIVFVVCVFILAGCSVQKMAGESLIDYAKAEAIPYLMAQDDLASACAMGEGMSPVMLSLSRIGVATDDVGVGMLMASGMCAERVQREAELDKARALYANASVQAQDALIREKQGHYLSARRMYAAYAHALAAFGDLSQGCRRYKTVELELLSLLGLASGALAILHDFSSEKALGISLDVPVKIEKAAGCFDDSRWWGMPTALRASIWLSIPGSGPEGVDPLAALEEAAQKGDAQGVGLARAMLVQMSAAVGRQDVMCQAIEEAARVETANASYAMLNAYARDMIAHQADLAWVRSKGHRAPFLVLQCPSETPVVVSMSDSEVDDLLDGLGDDADDLPSGADAAEGLSDEFGEDPHGDDA